MNMFPLEDQAKSGSIKNHEPTTLKPTEESLELLLKKIQTPVRNTLDYNSGKNFDSRDLQVGVLRCHETWAAFNRTYGVDFVPESQIRLQLFSYF